MRRQSAFGVEEPSFAAGAFPAACCSTAGRAAANFGSKSNLRRFAAADPPRYLPGIFRDYLRIKFIDAAVDAILVTALLSQYRIWSTIPFRSRACKPRNWTGAGSAHSDSL